LTPRPLEFLNDADKVDRIAVTVVDIADDGNPGCLYQKRAIMAVSVSVTRPTSGFSGQTFGDA